jgi:glutamate N-acetyltransferase/amino-acid N-acetyltransferase
MPGSICAPHGFRAAAVFCDIKRLGTGKGSEKGRKRDLALIASDARAAVAGMFTTNQVCAPPVKISRRVAARNFARAIVVNSGNANAATGKQGLIDTRRMAEITASALKLKANEILVGSTGRIGVAMPMKNIERGIRSCVPFLRRSISRAHEVAEAIMTTDTRRKEIAVEFRIDDLPIRIGGICKGAGMIQPGMAATHATMLAFITSDIAIETNLLKGALQSAVERSFNRITVDGDMSTNDSVIMLANGLAGNRTIHTRDSRFKVFQTALNFICLELAKMIVRDGEGVSRFITLHIHGAYNVNEAEAAARAIANSSLVKASWCGGDPNWGRILCALGYSKAKVNESLVDIGYAKPGSSEILFAFRRGYPTNTPLKALARISAAPEFKLHVDLHLGHADFVIFASDLTEDYVALNKGNVNDPTTLGG